MHADPTQYALAAAPTLAATLVLLADGTHTPIAGGTEIMVALAAGRLQQKSLISINHLTELRFIRIDDTTITIGANTTFTDIRRNAQLAADLPLLVQSASWTGSIANQNRATLGGNICNASPAADTPPALLAYNATVTLVSSGAAAGEIAQRTIPYTDFHQSYKRTALQPNELLHSITIPRAYAAHQHFIRKVGTRNAQAISKIALAAIARLNENQTLTEVRLGAASLTDHPTRLYATERVLTNASFASAHFPNTLRQAQTALASESHPIDDIRSTARYRSAVAANLLEQFLRSLTV
ncbi:MAG: FAD binding domain-containing protein [Acidobacteriaceae bacterium]